MLLIAIALTWAIKNAIDERKFEYRSGYGSHSPADKSYWKSRQPAGAKPWGRSYSGERGYAAGWFAYQLRFGFPGTVAGVRIGWNKGKAVHKAWKAELKAQGLKPTLIGAIKHAWKGASEEGKKNYPDPRPAASPAPQPVAPAAPAIPAPAPTQPTDKKVAGPPVPAAPTPTQGAIPMNASNTNGTGPVATTTQVDAPVDAGESHKIGLYRTSLNGVITRANARMVTAEASRAAADKKISTAQAEISAQENSANNLRANGVGEQTVAGLGDLMMNAQEELDAAREEKAAADRTLQRAERTKAAAERSLQELDRQGHTGVEQAVGAANQTEVAKSTDWYAPA